MLNLDKNNLTRHDTIRIYDIDIGTTYQMNPKNGTLCPAPKSKFYVWLKKKMGYIEILLCQVSDESRFRRSQYG